MSKTRIHDDCLFCVVLIVPESVRSNKPTRGLRLKTTKYTDVIPIIYFIEKLDTTCGHPPIRFQYIQTKSNAPRAYTHTYFYLSDKIGVTYPTRESLYPFGLALPYTLSSKLGVAVRFAKLGLLASWQTGATLFSKFV